MAAEVRCYKETGELLENMIKGALEHSRFSGIPIEPKWYDSIEALKKIASGIQQVGCRLDNGEVWVTMR